MKDAIGGSVLIKFMMLFIVLLNTFLALTVNYTRAFRVKNRLVALLEQYEEYRQAESSIAQYIESIGYYVTGGVKAADCATGQNDIYGGALGEWVAVSPSDTNRGGYCYRLIEDNQLGVRRGYHYQVAAFVHLEFPLVFWNLNFPIHGETKVIWVR